MRTKYLVTNNNRGYDVHAVVTNHSGDWILYTASERTFVRFASGSHAIKVPLVGASEISEAEALKLVDPLTLA